MIEIQLPQDGVEADIKVVDKDNKVVEGVDRILIRPYFHNPRVSSNVLYLRVLCDSNTGGELQLEPLDELSRVALQLSGISGKFKILDFVAERTLPEFIAKYLVGPSENVVKEEEDEDEYEEEEEEDDDGEDEEED